MILDLTFAGQLPYQRRLQLLDLASWRVLNRAVDLRDDLLQRELLSAEALATLIQGRARANQLLSESDDADPFDFEYAARRFSRVWPGDFVPVLVSHRINIARLTNDERFGLPASVLAVAATEMTPWTLQSVQSTNPLTAKVVFAATLGILVGAAVL